MSTYNIERLLAPRSLALVGGSLRPNSLGRAILRNLRAADFPGPVGLANPYYAEIDGLKAVRTLAALPFVPDLVVVTVPPAAIPGVVEDAGRKGSAGALIISAGLGHGPGSRAEAVERIARAYRMRLIGPNSIGALAPRARLNASFASSMPRAGDLALISQSGAIAAAMVDWAAGRSVGFSGIVSVGDQLDIDLADLLDYFALDGQTRAILLYIEAVKDARKFMSAARAAARTKPVVVVKSGRMAPGARAAATHTGALAGSDAVYAAAFRRAGLLRVLDLREFFDCAETLGRIRPPSGKRLAILTNGGGIGVLAIDRLVELGGIPAEIGKAAYQRLDTLLPPIWSHGNPVDIVGDADPQRYAASLEALLADDENDALLVMNVQTAVASAAEIAQAVTRVVVADRETRFPPKAVLAAWIGNDESVAATFSAAAIPNYRTEDDAVRGFMHMVRYREAVAALMEVPPSLPASFSRDVVKARTIVATAVAEGRRWLDPVEAVSLLEAYGIPVVRTVLAADPEAARAAAMPFLQEGSAAAVKILSRDIVRKSDAGGVRLNLASAEAVETAAREVMTKAQAARPAARIEGVTVQPMVLRRHGRELIAGIAADPTFGPVVVFGRGGTAVEVINDKAIALPPLDLKMAHDLIGQTRVTRRLNAYRDVAAADREAIALVLVRLAQMAADLPEIRGLDIDPLVADESGAIAVDARVEVAKPVAGGARLAVRPYPDEWRRTLEVKDGWRVRVRPIRPEDEPLLIELAQQVSPEDLRLRFFAPMKTFTHAFFARLTQLDYARAMAFAALDEADKIIGVVRLHADANYETAEYAILLRSDLKGRGLGWALMKLLIAYAKSEGLKSLTGQVLRGNQAMLRMCRALGFSVRPDPDDGDVYHVSLSLQDGLMVPA
ncbi:GCN5 family N-acetyltransferase [Afipia sp. P52-10]|uniref:bifunctional acetate--CoA ligase family protein/GNAT family N-acetyltransferase n=1 Tax=Afipia sp. P52-10 TaxID=1429916 RepID=UPI0003DF3527|nr:bifunctional acetate--CoA ligase family protein/GNAT family N-acetyltransferase [Afipia sp. P52-10]ETR78784.1 GCN5 family N-acetyltransferase [Afipia sp. P52-10]